MSSSWSHTFATGAQGKYLQMVKLWGGWELFQQLLGALKKVSACSRLLSLALACSCLLLQFDCFQIIWIWLLQIAGRYGVSISNVATRAVLQQPVAAVIIGQRLGESSRTTAFSSPRLCCLHLLVVFFLSLPCVLMPSVLLYKIAFSPLCINVMCDLTCDGMWDVLCDVMCDVYAVVCAARGGTWDCTTGVSDSTYLVDNARIFDFELNEQDLAEIAEVTDQVC